MEVGSEMRGVATVLRATGVLSHMSCFIFVAFLSSFIFVLIVAATFDVMKVDTVAVMTGTTTGETTDAREAMVVGMMDTESVMTVTVVAMMVTADEMEVVTVVGMMATVVVTATREERAKKVRKIPNIKIFSS